MENQNTMIEELYVLFMRTEHDALEVNPVDIPSVKAENGVVLLNPNEKQGIEVKLANFIDLEDLKNIISFSEKWGLENTKVWGADETELGNVIIEFSK